MGRQHRTTQYTGKKIGATSREMTTALFLLRTAQLGISISDLELLTIGMVQDMYVEAFNDNEGEYARVASQEDFDRF